MNFIFSFYSLFSGSLLLSFLPSLWPQIFLAHFISFLSLSPFLLYHLFFSPLSFSCYPPPRLLRTRTFHFLAFRLSLYLPPSTALLYLISLFPPLSLPVRHFPILLPTLFYPRLFLFSMTMLRGGEGKGRRVTQICFRSMFWQRVVSSAPPQKGFCLRRLARWRRCVPEGEKRIQVFLLSLQLFGFLDARP